MQNLSQHYHAVLKVIDDPYLPSQIAAVDALATLIEKQPSGACLLYFFNTRRDFQSYVRS